MTGYSIFAKKRHTKQFITGLVFLAILIGGWKYPLLGYFIPLCMFLGAGLAFSRGRKWCDWLCPRVSFYDVMVKPISPKKEIPGFFKRLPLRIGMLVFLMLMMIIQIIKRWPDPYKIGMFFVMLLTITTVIGVILALIFHQRTWCCFCPIGSMANWLSIGKYPLKIDSKLCTECKLCNKVCSIQVAPFEFKRSGVGAVKDRDCLKCGLCVSSCPKGALGFKRGGE